MGIQSGINRVLTLAGTVSAIQEKIKQDADKTAAAAAKPKKKKTTTKKTTTSTRANKKVAARNEEIQRSREFAKMITEGVPNLSFNPDEYIPPKKGDK